MQVSNPKTVKVGCTKYLKKAGETTSEMAKKYGAVAGINGGGFVDKNWSSTGGTPTGIVMSEGEVLYCQDKKLKYDMIGFDDKGQLIIGRYNLSELKKMNVKEAVQFKLANVPSALKVYNTMWVLHSNSQAPTIPIDSGVRASSVTIFPEVVRCMSGVPLAKYRVSP